MTTPDIDIEVKDRNEVLRILQQYHNASIIKNNKITKHNTGIYACNVKHDLLNNLCTIDHKQMEEKPYNIPKIDLLNSNILGLFNNRKEILELLKIEPDWNMFKNEEIVSQLFQLSKHYDIVQQYLPDSIYRVAMILALIRPGKKYLIGNSWEDIEKEIWIKPTDGYYFKKSHAIAYAMVIILQLNLIKVLQS